MAYSEQLTKENCVKINRYWHKVYRGCRLVPVFHAGRSEQIPEKNSLPGWAPLCSIPPLFLHNSRFSRTLEFTLGIQSFTKISSRLDHQWSFIHSFLGAALGLCCYMWAFSSCSAWASHCGGFSCFWNMGSRREGSVVVDELHCPTACGIFLEQGSNPCPLHWQLDS